MNKIIVIGGGKGGVGKTTITIGVVDALLTRDEQVVMVETDDSNPDAYKSLNKLVTSEICNLDNEDGFMALGNIIEANKDACVVVNCAARTTKGLVTHGGIVADVCKEQGRELVMIWPINRQRDSVELLKEFLDGAVGFAATHVLKNTYFGSPEKFLLFDNSAQKKRATGIVIWPELNDLLADKLNSGRLALSSVIEGLTIAERSVLQRYRNGVGDAIKGVL